MKEQSSIEQLIELIDFKISILEMDALNHVQWSNKVMWTTLVEIKQEAKRLNHEATK